LLREHYDERDDDQRERAVHEERLDVVFAKELGAASREGDGALAGRTPLARLQHVLLGSLGLQFTLGVLATYGIYGLSGGMTSEVSLGEAIFASSHVVVGTVLFSSTVVGAAWARRTLQPRAAVGAPGSNREAVA
ncbi:MAG: hypothetical protein AAFP22_19240, partial [Planctomycetota bacterium]